LSGGVGQQKIGGAWLFCAKYRLFFYVGKEHLCANNLFDFSHILHVKPLAGGLHLPGAGAYNPLKERDFPAPKIGR